MRLVVRIRSVLARHPSLYWGSILIASAVVAATVVGAIDRLEQSRREWGTTRSVLVADHDLAPGERLVVVERRLPVAALPAAALTSDAIVAIDAVAVQHIGSGEVITDLDVGRGPLALLPTGGRGVAIPVFSGALPVSPGDHVDVLADGAVIADDAVVVSVGDDAIVVGVDETDAGLVGLAAAAQTATLALRRP